jgi:N-formylmaleamate deformylase
MDESLPAADAEAYLRGGHGSRSGMGVAPAVVVVDLTRGFLEAPEGIGGHLDATTLVDNTAAIVQSAHEADVPVVFTRPDARLLSHEELGSISRKRVSSTRRSLSTPSSGEIPRRLGYEASRDIVLDKSAASPFAGTDLLKVLIFHRIDTLILCGATTSGCVRATAVDAAGLNYYVLVPREAVADRAPESHRMSLIEMDMKYADVVGVGEALSYLSSLGKPD